MKKEIKNSPNPNNTNTKICENNIFILILMSFFIKL